SHARAMLLTRPARSSAPRPTLRVRYRIRPSRRVFRRAPHARRYCLHPPGSPLRRQRPRHRIPVSPATRGRDTHRSARTESATRLNRFAPATHESHRRRAECTRLSSRRQRSARRLAQRDPIPFAQQEHHPPGAMPRLAANAHGHSPARRQAHSSARSWPRDTRERPSVLPPWQGASQYSETDRSRQAVARPPVAPESSVLFPTNGAPARGSSFGPHRHALRTQRRVKFFHLLASGLTCIGTCGAQCSDAGHGAAYQRLEPRYELHRHRRSEPRGVHLVEVPQYRSTIATEHDQFDNWKLIGTELIDSVFLGDTPSEDGVVMTDQLFVLVLAEIGCDVNSHRAFSVAVCALLLDIRANEHRLPNLSRGLIDDPTLDAVRQRGVPHERCRRNRRSHAPDRSDTECSNRSYGTQDQAPRIRRRSSAPAG